MHAKSSVLLWTMWFVSFNYEWKWNDYRKFYHSRQIGQYNLCFPTFFMFTYVNCTFVHKEDDDSAFLNIFLPNVFKILNEHWSPIMYVRTQKMGWKTTSKKHEGTNYGWCWCSAAILCCEKFLSFSEFWDADCTEIPQPTHIISRAHKNYPFYVTLYSIIFNNNNNNKKYSHRRRRRRK